MSKSRQRAFGATQLFIIITVAIFFIWKNLLNLSPDLNLLPAWIIAISFSIIDLWLFIVVLTGWLNIDIFKALKMEDRSSDEIF